MEMKTTNAYEPLEASCILQIFSLLRIYICRCAGHNCMHSYGGVYKGYVRETLRTIANVK